MQRWFDVMIRFSQAGALPEEVHYDGIRGIDEQDALRNAEANWPDADAVIVISEEETA